MTDASPLRLGLVGAGGFATFLAGAVETLPSVTLHSVADARPEPALRLATTYDARVAASLPELLADAAVDAVVVATPPSTHGAIARAALEAGKDVLCEKPLALDDREAADLVATVERTGGVLVVDHVLRYNPLLRALNRLRDGLLGPVQRFCFENDASDEDLSADHWFWDESLSGGIFVEHGVHFFDAAAMLLDRDASSVHAVTARRPDGPVDLVSATVAHGEDVLASHTHSFAHAHRCERQLMRLDCGAAEVRVEGWIPVHAVVDAWTDDAGVRFAEDLPDDLLHVDGFRLGPRAGFDVAIRRDAAPARARGRGRLLDVPHHVRLELTLGGHAAKAEAYRESVRAALTDLVVCADTGRTPFSGVREGAAAVAVATAATRSARLQRAERIDPVPVAVR
ncbi:MAG TPA: Gfo/Idh/MocA family oxidoreductase [Nocardioides sp.]|uniref:Gfo/Idh/MocA family protein n=1 Tax=Nocardioides sp. TaxID=35761 RepID=UPI002D8009B8|nr:Gfo/Idh/MocA family oxidoreductase [Nocardioides sp.]HET6651241.1 Gfo/Idh/MocA family oxidoreductase [Nocardioides sp.]